MIRPTPRDATFAGLGALTFPVCLHVTMRMLGRHVLDPDYRKDLTPKPNPRETRTSDLTASGTSATHAPQSGGA